MNSKKYSQFFSIPEIEQSRALQAVFWALLFGFYIAFSDWSRTDLGDISSVKSISHVCPTYFQNCEGLYFFDGSPGSYSKDLYYTFILFVMGLCGFFAYLGKWTMAHLGFFALTIWKILFITFFIFSFGRPFEYFHLGLIVPFLFFKDKFRSLQLSFVLFYFIAGFIKIDDGWVLGSYFSSLKTGLPLIPDILIPVAANFVLLLEIFTPVLLLSKSTTTRRATLVIYLFFHFYSALFVGYRFPSHSIPALLILFGGEFTKEKIFIGKNPLLALYLTAVLFINFLPILLGNDRQGAYDGASQFTLHMFDSNSQCLSQRTIVHKDGTVFNDNRFYNMAGYKCYLYKEFFYAKKLCEKENVERVKWTYALSLNGKPFYEMTRTNNVCGLQYKTFAQNHWIIEPKKRQILGYPGKNHYKAPLSSGFSKHPLQGEKNEPYFFSQAYPYLVKAYWFLSAFVLVVFFGRSFSFRNP